jgi:hypothetical protein
MGAWCARSDCLCRHIPASAPPSNPADSKPPACAQKHVHLKCLQTWQIQLRQQKGAISARRCDVCRAPWARQFARPGQRGSPHWAAAADAARALQPWVLTLARWWKVVALAQGVLHGMEAGAAGFRLGLRYHAVAAARHAGGRHDAGSLLRWAPFSVWAAGVVPPVALPAALAIFVAASSAGAVQGAVMAAAGLYAGGVAGFAHGVTQTALTSMQALSGGLGAATRGVAAGLHALLRLLTCWW